MDIIFQCILCTFKEFHIYEATPHDLVAARWEGAPFLPHQPDHLCSDVVTPYFLQVYAHKKNYSLKFILILYYIEALAFKTGNKILPKEQCQCGLINHSSAKIC